MYRVELGHKALLKCSFKILKENKINRQCVVMSEHLAKSVLLLLNDCCSLKKKKKKKNFYCLRPE